MRHLIFSLLTICSMTSHAQQIAIDKTDADGLRTISTSLEVCRNATDKTVFSFGLTAYISSLSSYSLNLKVTSPTPIKIMRGSALSIKTFRGTTLQLQNLIDVDGSVRDVHNINGYVFSDYSACPSFSITSEELNTIISEGLATLHIQTTTSDIDKVYKKDKASKILSSDLRLINDAIQVPK